MDLAAETWTGLDRPLLVVPLGSCEQHGPHLPLGTDTFIATAFADELARRLTDALVAPALAIAASGEHADFAGTLSIGTDTTTSVLVELVRSAGWAGGVVVVNGHGGNVDALRQAESVWRAEGRDVLVWSPRVPGGDLHAGRTETSLMLAIRPDLVHLDRAVSGPTASLEELVERGVRAVSPSGVLGDPHGAGAEEGHRLLSELADDLYVATRRRWP